MKNSSCLALGGVFLLLAACHSSSGTAAAAGQLTVAPKSLDFGEVEIGQPRTLGLSLTNAGNVPLAITRVTISDDARGSFSVDSTGQALEPSETKVVLMTYRPLSEGVDAVTLSLETDSRQSPVVLVAVVGHTPVATDGGNTPRAPATVTYSTAALVCTRGVPCELNAPAITGGTPDHFEITPALPAGLTLTATGAIEGTPLAESQAASYEIVASNAVGSASAQVSLEVVEGPPTSVSYASGLTCIVGQACALAAPTVSGGAAHHFASEPALPAGLSLDALTGAISGTPTQVLSATFRVTASNGSGSTTTSVMLVVNDRAPAGLKYAAASLTCKVGVSCTLAAPTSSGGLILSFAVQPSLPAGLTLDPLTGALSGTPTAMTASASYVVTADNPSGSTTASVQIAVLDAAPTNLVYASSTLTCTLGTACSLAKPTSKGGAVVSFSVNPGLPGGLHLDAATGAISGTPTGLTAGSAVDVTATNSGGSTTTHLIIIVNDVPPAALTYSQTSVVCWSGSPCTLPAPTSTGGVIVRVSAQPSLPAGLTLDSTGALSGAAATASPATTYTLTAFNSGGSTTTTLSLRVNDPARLPNTLNTSRLAALNLTVTGTGLSQYRYKLVAADTCTDAAGYSASRPLATTLTDSLVTQIDTTWYLCALGVDADGNWQPLSLASRSVLTDATALLDASPRAGATLLRAWDIDAGAIATSYPIVISDQFDGGMTGTCGGCEVSVGAGPWSSSVDAGSGASVRIRHVAATTPATERSTVLTWAAGGQWKFYSLTKTAVCAGGAKRIFVTKSGYTGNMGGIAGADAKCQAEASAAALGGTWKAVIGDLANPSPMTRLATGSYCSLEGREVINSQGFVGPITKDLAGAIINPGENVTANFPIKPRATLQYWYGGSDYDCSGWTTAVATVNGRDSALSYGDPVWGWFTLTMGGAGSVTCDVPLRLLCFEQ